MAVSFKTLQQSGVMHPKRAVIQFLKGFYEECPSAEYTLKPEDIQDLLEEIRSLEETIRVYEEDSW